MTGLGRGKAHGTEGGEVRRTVRGREPSKERGTERSEERGRERSNEHRHEQRKEQPKEQLTEQPKERVGRRLALRDGDPAVILRHWREAVPNDRLAHLIKDATRVLNRALQERLARYEVSFGHWTFLRILWEHDGLTQRELSDQAGVMEPTTHAALSAMEARGLIQRRRLDGDKRNQHIFVTPSGKRLKAQLVPRAVEVNRLAIRGMRADDVAVARRVLLGIIENLAAAEGPAAPAPASTTPNGKPA